MSIEGLKVDVVSQEVRKFFGILPEQLFSSLLVHTTLERAGLRFLNPRCERLGQQAD